MKLLASFAALLLILQVATAVSFDVQQHQPRLVKVKRNMLGQPAPGSKAYHLGPSVKKRSLAELLAQHDELLSKFFAESNPEAKDALMKQMNESARKLREHPEMQAHYAARRLGGEASTSAAAERVQGEGARYGAQPQRPLAGSDVEGALRYHEEGLINHDVAIDQMIKSNKELSDKLKAAKKASKWQSIAAGGALGTATMVAGTSIISTNANGNRFKADEKVINDLQTDVARLKAQNAQGPPASTLSGQGVPATNGAAAGGSLV